MIAYVSLDYVYDSLYDAMWLLHIMIIIFIITAWLYLPHFTTKIGQGSVLHPVQVWLIASHMCWLALYLSWQFHRVLVLVRSEKMIRIPE